MTGAVRVAVGADRLPLVDGLLVRAFAFGREEHGDDKFHAARMFDEALRRDPYHPGGLYDLACTLAGAGYRQGARSALLAAIGDGDDRLAERYAHDPDLAGLDIPADDLHRAVHNTSHELSGFQVRPTYEDGCIRFRIRPDMRARAVDRGPDVLWLRPDQCDLRSYRDEETGGFVEYSAEEFELHMQYVARFRFRGWDLHCALRRIAPLVEDTHGFVWDANDGGNLDEIAVVDGHLTLVRQHTGVCDRWTRRELLKERTRLAPDDQLLAEAVIAEFG